LIPHIDVAPQGLADIISNMEDDSFSVEELVRAADIMASTGERRRQT
jgi:hypothetical protein